MSGSVPKYWLTNCWLGLGLCLFILSAVVSTDSSPARRPEYRLPNGWGIKVKWMKLKENSQGILKAIINWTKHPKACQRTENWNLSAGKWPDWQVWILPVGKCPKQLHGHPWSRVNLPKSKSYNWSQDHSPLWETDLSCFIPISKIFIMTMY